MNKKVLAIIASVLLLVLGLWFYMSSQKKGDTGSGSETAENKTPETAQNLKDLITKGTAQTCTFSTESGSNGSVYVSGGKVRGDFDTTIEGKVTKTHMIIMDNTDYIWTEGQKTGFKMTLDLYATPSTTGTTTDSTYKGDFNPTANNNYKCSTWAVDPSKFSLPDDVTFGTFAMPAGVTGQGSGSTGTGSAGASQCSYCSALTGDDKTQCLKALNCN